MHASGRLKHEARAHRPCTGCGAQGWLMAGNTRIVGGTAARLVLGGSSEGSHIRPALRPALEVVDDARQLRLLAHHLRGRRGSWDSH
jgi:hypothetical protein